MKATELRNGMKVATANGPMIVKSSTAGPNGLQRVAFAEELMLCRPDTEFLLVREFYIRCKADRMRRAVLLAGAGDNGNVKTTGKRIHASLIPEDRLAGCLAELRQLNPDWTFKAVEA